VVFYRVLEKERNPQNMFLVRKTEITFYLSEILSKRFIQLEQVYEILTFDIRFVTRETANLVLAKYRQIPSYVHWYLYTYNIQQHN